MVLKLYHVGFLEIKEPDIRFGRKNADFGQGFYLSPDLSFSRRWARAEKGKETYLNAYELDTEGLRVKEFKGDSEWFSYISKNRNGEGRRGVSKSGFRDFDGIEKRVGETPLLVF